MDIELLNEQDYMETSSATAFVQFRIFQDWMFIKSPKQS
jgi:hypothetical protein